MDSIRVARLIANTTAHLRAAQENAGSRGDADGGREGRLIWAMQGESGGYRSQSE
jgi:hypothetical protein